MQTLPLRAQVVCVLVWRQHDICVRHSYLVTTTDAKMASLNSFEMEGSLAMSVAHKLLLGTHHERKVVKQLYPDRTVPAHYGFSLTVVCMPRESIL